MKLIDLQDRCWICAYKDNFNLIDHDLFNEVKDDLAQKELQWYGKTILMPRLTAWYGDGDYFYSGTVNKAKPMPETVKFIRDSIERRVNHLPGLQGDEPILNSVLLNLYRDGRDSVDWHSDDESQLGPTDDNVVIVSVSFGWSRKFVLRNKKTRQKISLDLGQEDVLIMGGQTQKFWQHKVPKTSKKVGKRLNLTFRCFR